MQLGLGPVKALDPSEDFNLMVSPNFKNLSSAKGE
tara:strand:+ start:307 stop:411 length:105 start_codon:yes stop_codon:yes gene_type:complete